MSEVSFGSPQSKAGPPLAMLLYQRCAVCGYADSSPVHHGGVDELAVLLDEDPIAPHEFEPERTSANDSGAPWLTVRVVRGWTDPPNMVHADGGWLVSARLLPWWRRVLRRVQWALGWVLLERWCERT